MTRANVLMLIALVPVVAAGCLFFGLGVLLQIGVTAVCTVLGTVVVGKVLRRESRVGNGRTLVHAVILALMMPPGCGPAASALGAALLVLVEQFVGQRERFLWHPVLVARLLLCLLFPATMSPAEWVVLKKDHVVSGDLRRTEPMPANIGWLEAEGLADRQAWSVPQPITALCQVYSSSGGGHTGENSLLSLIRDRLPPAVDCLIGATAGPPGETCVVAILLGGLFLIYRGQVRWHLPVACVAGLLAAAAILPVADAGTDSPAWWPVRLYAPGLPTSLPVGLIFVWYHLIAGEFMLAVVFLASASECTPRRSRGRLFYGMAVGFLTVIFRSVGFGWGSAYWSTLLMNTAVPAIDWLTLRAEKAAPANGLVPGPQ